MPSPQTNQTIVVDRVRYSAAAPWPARCREFHCSLLTRHRTTAASPTGPPRRHSASEQFSQPDLVTFPPLWINELQADNLTGITNSAGQRTPWLELYNPSTNAILLTNLYLS